ncbi:hypothetical protein SASPL_109788 [Salvia splendens]|uniref:CMP/dCMP-type deaminase domain-containing protein n=1 Tax=Salvia splendens TaxID=180675 RepID=A0A8X8YKM8_SALSN|nr:hypothetical protein SASPL_109788 [Salvia splendens]
MLDIKTPDFIPLLEFLPNPFGPRDLLDEETPLLLEQHHNRLDLSDHDENSPFLCNGNHNSAKLSNGNHEINESLLKQVALEAANDAHAPYSGCPSGVALMDCEGKVYKGSYAESAAYNPSLGPVQAALVAYIARGGGDYERIVAAALVETKTAKIRQDDTARLLLKVISPKWRLQCINGLEFVLSDVDGVVRTFTDLKVEGMVLVYKTGLSLCNVDDVVCTFANLKRINGLEFVPSDVDGAVLTFANLKVEGMALASCDATLTNLPHI